MDLLRIAFCLAAVATAGAASSSSSSPLMYQLSEFLVNVTTTDSSSIKVVHIGTGVSVLESAGPAWLSVGAATEQRKPVSHDGGYTLKEEILTRTTELTVTGCVGDSSTVVVTGFLSTSLSRRRDRDRRDRGGYNNIAFNFSLTTISAATSNQLHFSAAVTDTPKGVNRLFFTHASAADEAVLGFGMQYSAWDMKGRYVPILSTEQGIGRGLQPITAALNLASGGAGGDWHTTYAPLPVYLTPGAAGPGRALALENSEFVAFDLKTRDDRIDVEVWALELSGEVMAAKSTLALLTEITELTGRMQPLPAWVQKGAIAGLEGGTAVVQNLTDVMLAAGVPLAAVWLQDWSGINHGEDGDRVWWNWEVDDGAGGEYEGWQGFVDGLLVDHDIRVMTYINPYFTNASAKASGYNHNYFAEGVAGGFFVKNSTGEAYLLASGHFDFAMLDFTNPEARNWLKEIVQGNMLRCKEGSGVGSGGAYGWMNDFGEYLPFDSVLHSGESAAAYHNRYPQEWSSLVAEAVEECGGAKEEVVFFSRSAALQSPRHTPLFWMGDQLVSWDDKDGIKTALSGMLTGGLTGRTLSHSDIGGFTVVSQGPDAGILPNYHYERTKELLLRWIELSAFSDCIFRTHPSSMLDGTVQVYSDSETLAFFARGARVHSALFDYRQSLIQEAASLGYPVTRPLLLHFPFDHGVTAKENDGLMRQFMLGPSLLVAPVLDEGAVTVRVYLPAISPDLWVHLWSNATFPSAEWVNVSAPLGQPGVFFRQGDAQGLALQDAILRAADEIPPVEARRDLK